MAFGFGVRGSQRPGAHFLRSWISDKAGLSGPRTHRPIRSHPVGSGSQHPPRVDMPSGRCAAVVHSAVSSAGPPLLQRSLSGPAAPECCSTSPECAQRPAPPCTGPSTGRSARSSTICTWAGKRSRSIWICRPNWVEFSAPAPGLTCRAGRVLPSTPPFPPLLLRCSSGLSRTRVALRELQFR
jgi:hypothetical protein